jgi:DNA-binding NarL/FixJ family response regulator
VKNQKSSCLLLANRHQGLRDGIRGLLETEFETVFMVADEASLLEGAEHLNPAIVVLDLSLAAGDLRSLVAGVTDRAPDTKIMMLTVHDEATVATAALAAGAEAVVLKRKLTTDLLPAVNALREGKRYLSPELSQRPINDSLETIS